MKNKTMRIAAVLLALTLMTSCFVGGTFAKYTTAGESLDSARVAKWGVTVSGAGKEAFAIQYNDVAGDAGTKVVSTEKVVAPGTEGTLAHFDISGEPEVVVRVSYEATLDFGSNWIVDYNDDHVNEPYCPIVVTVVYNGNTTVFYMLGNDANGNPINTVADLEAAVENYINSCAVIYPANTDLSAVAEDDLTVSWKWYFEDTTPGNPLSAYQNDNADTDLGNLTADVDDSNNPTISLSIKCTVTQVD